MATRARPKPPGNEEVSTTINLGELQGSQSLSCAETRLLLTRILATRKQQAPQNLRETEVLQRTVDHVEVFARHKEDNVVEQVSLLLQNEPQLENYERSKLGESRSASPPLSEWDAAGCGCMYSGLGCVHGGEGVLKSDRLGKEAK